MNGLVLIDSLSDGDLSKPSGGRAERIARQLSGRIIQQRLKPGTKLPAETALARHFGVSRTVIREAMAMLKAEGLVETMQGSGAYVLPPEAGGAEQPDNAFRASLGSLIDLLEVRRTIEGEIAARAAMMHGADALARIDAAFERLQLAERESRPGVGEDRAFHASIADAAGSAYWQMLTASLAKPIEIAISVTRTNEAMREGFAAAVAAEHAAIREAVAARNPDLARQAAARHMEQAAFRVMSADQEFWRTGGASLVNLPGG